VHHIEGAGCRSGHRFKLQLYGNSMPYSLA
jgi:hypothetical protein